jgi:hypothetical protein
MSMTARRTTTLTVTACCAALLTAFPATVGAFATPAPPPNAPSVVGLPDGRVYEEVSPANKHGNVVQGIGAATFAASDGEAILYTGTGALGDTPSFGAAGGMYVSQRSSAGWTTRSAASIPAPGRTSEEENIAVGALGTAPHWLDVSADVSHIVFNNWSHIPYVGPPDARGLANNLYLAGPDPFVEPEWIARSQIAGPPEGAEAKGYSAMYLAGGSPDLSTMYFFYEGTLLPGASHLYEYRGGVLSDAGTLPGEEASPSPAAPAAQPLVERLEFRGFTSPAGFDNEVSSDGSRLFFTRENGAGTLELYARVSARDGSHRTFIVSQSQMPGHEGEPALDGALAVPSTEWITTEPNDEGAAGKEAPPSYVFASPDGSHAFFQSVDRLTPEAPEGVTPKAYDFDLDSGSLEYLPGVTGSIVSSSPDGSSFVFENTATSPFELDRWSAGPGGGSVTVIAQLPSVSPNACGTLVCVGPAYASDDGSDVVFSTESPIAGFNDGGSHFARSVLTGELTGGPFANKEIFRYDSSSGQLSCLSCAPATVTPSGNAVISDVDEEDNDDDETGGLVAVTPGRGMSADGSRVFFDTPDALVPRDVNGMRDVYEWENGTIYLISSGRSTENSYFLDASESGDDAFISTTEGIAPGDTDGGRDVYDARIPRPGDNPPPAAVPCQGSVCQGAPSVPNLLGAPSSATFSGAGNLAPQAAAQPIAKPKKKARPKRKKKKKKKANAKGKKSKTRQRKPKGKSAKTTEQPSVHERRGDGRGN